VTSRSPSTVSHENITSAGAAQFGPTHWTVVLTARGDTTSAHVALEKLCQIYWPPVYAFIRRQGNSPHDAQDLTQDFFARLLEKNYLAAVDRSKGKFRSFLLASVKHFLANERDKVNAQKRGGGNTVLSIDASTAESSCVFDLRDNTTADKIFERRWAMTLLETTLARLRDEYIEAKKTNLFENLKGTLTGERNAIPYAEIAIRLGTTEGNVKVAVHRLRQRYREVLRNEIAQTVADPSEVDEELRNLFAALAG
jgi:RNA polymerase sigma factor (sigma-70 family)